MQAPYSQDYTGPADQARRAGKSPDVGILGPNPKSASDPNSFKNDFIARYKLNPDSKTFYSQGIFPGETANLSQQKYDEADGSPYFANPDDQTLANDFVSKYSTGISRGLIEEDRAITSSSVDQFRTKKPREGLGDSNVVSGKFPGAGGVATT